MAIIEKTKRQVVLKERKERKKERKKKDSIVVEMTYCFFCLVDILGKSYARRIGFFPPPVPHELLLRGYANTPR